jgi:hypothetical protein
VGAHRRDTIAGMRSLLDPTGNEAAERAAIACLERPGTWCGDLGGDGRLLTQEQTDYLIRRELLEISDAAGRAELRRAIGRVPRVIIPVPPNWVASRQRGGIDSDPLVRLLAYRAWGDRDRYWLEAYGVRVQDLIIVSDSGEVVRAWPADGVHGLATRDAHPGTRVEVFVNRVIEDSRPSDEGGDHRRVTIRGLWKFRVGERPRVAPGGAAASNPDVEHRRHPMHVVCVHHDFDQLQFERHRLQDGLTSRAAMTASRAGHSARVHIHEVDAAVLFDSKFATVFQRYSTDLASQLDQLVPRWSPTRRRDPIRR